MQALADDTEDAPYQTIDGLVGLAHQVRAIEALLRSNWRPARGWLVDNREIFDAEEPELERLVSLVRSHPGKLEDIVVAWVTQQPCPLHPALLRRLPFVFRAFESLSEADRWLRRKLAETAGAEDLRPREPQTPARRPPRRPPRPSCR